MERKQIGLKNIQGFSLHVAGEEGKIKVVGTTAIVPYNPTIAVTERVIRIPPIRRQIVGGYKHNPEGKKKPSMTAIKREQNERLKALRAKNKTIVTANIQEQPCSNINITSPAPQLPSTIPTIEISQPTDGELPSWALSDEELEQITPAAKYSTAVVPVTNEPKLATQTPTTSNLDMAANPTTNTQLTVGARRRQGLKADQRSTSAILKPLPVNTISPTPVTKTEEIEAIKQPKRPTLVDVITSWAQAFSPTYLTKEAREQLALNKELEAMYPPEPKLKPQPKLKPVAKRTTEKGLLPQGMQLMDGAPAFVNVPADQELGLATGTIYPITPTAEPTTLLTRDGQQAFIQPVTINGMIPEVVVDTSRSNDELFDPLAVSGPNIRESHTTQALSKFVQATDALRFGQTSVARTLYSEALEIYKKIEVRLQLTYESQLVYRKAVEGSVGQTILALFEQHAAHEEQIIELNYRIDQADMNRRNTNIYSP